MKVLTHADIQKGASAALHRAMKEGVAYELRQVGDDLQLTTVVETDVTGKVLAVSYPDGGIDYYPTLTKETEGPFTWETYSPTERKEHVEKVEGINVVLLDALKQVVSAHAHIETANMPAWLEQVEEAINKA